MAIIYLNEHSYDTTYRQTGRRHQKDRNHGNRIKLGNPRGAY